MRTDDRLAARFGPLRYVLHAHDRRSRRQLAAIREGVECVAFDGPPDRVVHVTATAADGFSPFISAGMVPPAVRRAVTEDLPGCGWRFAWREIKWMAWDHPGDRSACWVWIGEDADELGPYQLPWAILHRDMAARRGSLCHGALAMDDQGAGHLFVAPPDGGKTTTVTRLLSSWRVLGDDTCLVWQTGEGAAARWFASPLPSWGSLLGKSARPARIGRWPVAETTELRRVLVLEKRPTSSLTDLAPVSAARPLCLAFLEHPQLTPERFETRTHAFRLACALARAVPSQRLALTLDADLGALLGR